MWIMIISSCARAVGGQWNVDIPQKHTLIKLYRSSSKSIKEPACGQCLCNSSPTTSSSYCPRVLWTVVDRSQWNGIQEIWINRFRFQGSFRSCGHSLYCIKRLPCFVRYCCKSVLYGSSKFLIGHNLLYQVRRVPWRSTSPQWTDGDCDWHSPLLSCWRLSQSEAIDRSLFGHVPLGYYEIIM